MLDEEKEREIGLRLRGKFGGFCGIRAESSGEGECVMALELQPQHTNPWGMAHGGLIFTLMDSAAGWASQTVRPEKENCRQVTQCASVFFLTPAREGTLRAYARVIRAGRVTGLVQVDVKDNEDRLIAHADISVFYFDQQ